jgi:hypothetical protein
MHVLNMPAQFIRSPIVISYNPPLALSVNKEREREREREREKKEKEKTR